MLGNIRTKLSNTVRSIIETVHCYRPRLSIGFGLGDNEKEWEETGKTDVKQDTDEIDGKEPSRTYLTKEAWYETTIPDERLANLGSDDIIPDEYATELAFDLRQKYWFLANIKGKDTTIDEDISGWFSVESDYLHTLGEWLELLADCVSTSPHGYSIDIEQITEIKFIKRG